VYPVLPFVWPEGLQQKRKHRWYNSQLFQPSCKRWRLWSYNILPHPRMPHAANRKLLITVVIPRTITTISFYVEAYKLTLRNPGFRRFRTRYRMQIQIGCRWCLLSSCCCWRRLPKQKLIFLLFIIEGAFLYSVI
jgi:hypothetical protein